MSNQRRTREEILNIFQACQAKAGKPPGREVFFKLSGVKASEISYYWPRYSELVKEAGAQPNEFQLKLPDEEVFQEYAKACLHLGKLPTHAELRIVQREIKTRTYGVYERFDGIEEFRAKFRNWLQGSTPEMKTILEFAGWGQTGNNNDSPEFAPETANVHPGLRPFLPSNLQYLDVLARGERPPFEPASLSLSTAFEKRTADAFRSLGFEIKSLGQGTGRNADVLALALRERFALIIDAKVRTKGYELGTEDRKFLEYARNHGTELKRQGFDNIYFVVVGGGFREGDLKKLTEYLSGSPIRSVDLITASALIRLVEESIRYRSTFSLVDFEKHLFGNKIIAQ
jgi:hypothetical protein